MFSLHFFCLKKLKGKDTLLTEWSGSVDRIFVITKLNLGT